MKVYQGPKGGSLISDLGVLFFGGGGGGGLGLLKGYLGMYIKGISRGYIGEFQGSLLVPLKFRSTRQRGCQWYLRAVAVPADRAPSPAETLQTRRPPNLNPRPWIADALNP